MLKDFLLEKFLVDLRRAVQLTPPPNGTHLRMWQHRTDRTLSSKLSTRENQLLEFPTLSSYICWQTLKEKIRLPENREQLQS